MFKHTSLTLQNLDPTCDTCDQRLAASWCCRRHNCHANKRIKTTASCAPKIQRNIAGWTAGFFGKRADLAPLFWWSWNSWNNTWKGSWKKYVRKTQYTGSLGHDICKLVLTTRTANDNALQGTKGFMDMFASKDVHKPPEQITTASLQNQSNMRPRMFPSESEHHRAKRRFRAEFQRGVESCWEIYMLNDS